MIAKDNHRTTKILAGKRVGVFGKGGAGKSTAIVLLARILRERGYEVCVLDADSTNLGLPQAMGIDQSPVPLIDYFGGAIFSGGLVTCPVDDPMPLPESEVSLEELPSKYYAQDQQGITLLIAGKIGAQGAGAGCDGPVSKIARDFKITRDGEAPVMLVDFKAGFEDTARGVITSLDWAIVLVDPTIAAVEMAVNMRDTIDQIKDGGLPATHHLENPTLVAMANRMFLKARIKGALFVMNKIQSEEMKRYLEAKLAEREIEPVGIIREHPAISIAWLQGKPLAIPEAHEEVQKIVKELEALESSSPRPEIQ
jgi:CO dehydrogenase nickel-insertion accessory protein CooC1